MLQAVLALFGAIATILFSGLLLESYKRHRDLQGTASALAGEIYSNLHINEKRQTARNFAFLLSQLEAGKQINWPDVTGGDRSEDDPVMNAYLEKVGLLPGNLPERVATFYTYLRGIRVDVRSLSKGVFAEPVAQATVVRADLVLWAEANQLGNKLWSDLRQIAIQPWWLLRVSRELVRKLRYHANTVLKSIGTDLQRLRGIKLDGEGFGELLQPCSETQNTVEDLTGLSGDTNNFDPPFHELVTEIATYIRNVMRPADDRALRHALIDYQAALVLERASRFLFGSQIDALIFVGANGGRCVTEKLVTFYRTAENKFPEAYTNRPFTAWLGFLSIQNLISIEGDTITMTASGKGVISYMQNRGYLNTRADY